MTPGGQRGRNSPESYISFPWLRAPCNVTLLRKRGRQLGEVQCFSREERSQFHQAPIRP